MSEVNVPAFLESKAKTDPRLDTVEFVNENEGVVSAYRAEEVHSASPLVHMASPREDQHSLGESLPPDQKAYAPTSSNYEDYSNLDRTDFASFERSAVLVKPGLDEPNELQQRASTQLEQKCWEKSPELKFQTFQKSANFDTFRPKPRSHFSSDAMSVWPLRSIEESRLLQHFIQNIAPWVCL